MTPHEILSEFPADREARLRAIARYSMFEVFFYRPTLWHHELRVHYIIRALAPIVKGALPNCDVEKAAVLALVHDDAEMITGDVQLGHKQHMTAAETAQTEKNEEAAIEILAAQFPKTVGGYDYAKLLAHALKKDCIEARLVSYADKLDAYSESLHDLLGGNLSAVRAVINYAGIIPGFGSKFPDLKPLLARADFPLANIGLMTDPWKVHAGNYVPFGKAHTPESIRIPTEFAFYNAWRDLVIQNLGDEGVQILTEQKEFPKG